MKNKNILKGDCFFKPKISFDNYDKASMLLLLFTAINYNYFLPCLKRKSFSSLDSVSYPDLLILSSIKSIFF